MKLIESIDALDQWRSEYNGEHIGRGYDEYAKGQELEYPEAYALWGKGYLNLYQATGKKDHLERAEQCAKWLEANRSPIYENHSWGLPFEWREVPKETSYLITTVQAGELLLGLYKITSKQSYLSAAFSAARWVLEENGANRTANGIWFNYSPHPRFRVSVVSATSKASGFLSQLNELERNPEYALHAEGGIKYIVEKQNRDGSWNYSDMNYKIDNVHTALTIEGLCDAGLEANRIDLAARYYWDNLFEENGYGKEYVSPSITPLLPLRDMIRRMKLRLRIPETRLHGYGAGIKALTKASKITVQDNPGEMIAKYVISNLQDENGAFALRLKEHLYYIRYEGHIFDGLSYLLLRNAN